MPKVVIGEGVHGYRLAPSAIRMLARQSDCSHILRRPAERGDLDYEGDLFLVEDYVVIEDGHDRWATEHDPHAHRDCPALVRLIEALGQAAGHPDYCGRLGVVEVPDDVQWYLSVDGETSSECVAEVHRTWHLPEKTEKPKETR